MNRSQLIALWAGVLAFIGALLYPPFIVNKPQGQAFGRTFWKDFREWKWIWEHEPLVLRYLNRLDIDVLMLGVETAIIVLVTATFIISLKKKS